MSFCSEKSWSREGRHLTSVLKHTVHFRPHRLGTELTKCDKSYGGKVLTMKLKSVLWLQLPYSWCHTSQPGAILRTSLQSLETRSWEEHKKFLFKIPMFHRKHTLGDGMPLFDWEALSTLQMRLLCIALFCESRCLLAENRSSP